MRERVVVTLLRRIALGLPVAMGPLVVGLASGACSRCYAIPVGGSSHPRSELTDAFVGSPERFDPTNCNALCRALDGLEAVDASGLDGGRTDAGAPIYFPTPYPERVGATCVYSDDGTTLSCSYADRFCETATCGPGAEYGRTPMGLLAHRSLGRTPLARWLSDGAHLEAASVPAFEDLARELEAFGAPLALRHAAHRSAHDERRHARALGALARRLGTEVAPVRRTETGLRGPEDVAIDNAVEGCVREAYAALSAALQGERASSVVVRRTYRGIAADEARHALLSFATNDWLASALSGSARRRIEEARRQALADYAAGLGEEPEASLGVVLGLPDATRRMDVLSLLS